MPPIAPRVKLFTKSSVEISIGFLGRGVGVGGSGVIEGMGVAEGIGVADALAGS